MLVFSFAVLMHKGRGIWKLSICTLKKGSDIRVTNKKEHSKARVLSPKKIIMIITCTTTLFFVFSMLLSYSICGVVFSRREDVNLLALNYSDNMSENYPRQEMRFASGKNILCGYLYSPSDPHGVIVIAHGMRGDNTSHLSEAKAFIDNGWAVFTFDGTGAGSSTGDSTVGLQQMVLDLRAAMNHLASSSETSSLPIMLYGHSMGGYAAAVAAEESEAVAVVSISAFNSPMDLMLNSGKRYVGGIAFVGYPFLYLQNLLTFGEFTNKSASDAINNSDASFLIVHGTQDAVITDQESIMGQRENITNSSVTYMLIDEPMRNGHSGAWLTAEAMEYRHELEAVISSLQSEYDDDIPKDVIDDFQDNIDSEILYELDEDFINAVLEFYLSSIEK